MSLKAAYQAVWMGLLLFSMPASARFIDMDYPQTVSAILEQKDRQVDLKPSKTFKTLQYAPDGQAFFEDWTYHRTNDFQKIEIAYSIGQTHFSEHYSLLNRALIYATELEYTEYEPDSTQGLLINYFIKGGKLVHLSSTGHGKTEDDNWDAEHELMQRYKKRIKQLQNLLKSHPSNTGKK